ncbi:alpha/beta fold hydrolase [Bdellovibrio sp. ArHS]|uniref:alpha/beta fold hydrolase n=1 Tax=Bdellovibrio sp. ArHS TaxID=1569284 RepID=UPI0025BA1D31|nr:alpha/beta fold hydrolase [Bdellovibrio sp. ArHS]
MTRLTWPLYALLFLIAFQVQAKVPWTAPDTPYLSGEEVCAKYHDRRGREQAVWISVPVSYQDAAQGSFSLYTWTRKPWMPGKPVLIYVDGGPGNTSHSSELDLPDWNVVFFDQRGNSCSRPPTEELYLRRDFYDSRNTARDIDEIRKALGESLISVYGVSYGTVPAHLYGFLFPEHLRALVLEGVVAQADAETLINNPHRLTALQNFFETLPLSTRQRILQISQKPENAYWFADVGRMMMYLDRPWQAFTHFLDGVLSSDEALEALIPSFGPRKNQDEEFGFSQVMMNMLACKEMGMNTPGASFRARFQDGRLRLASSNELREENCQPLGFQESENFKVFRSENFPLTVPVTYLQGALDGATAAHQARRSYDLATRSFACLISIDQGGHVPVFGALSSGYESGASLVLRQHLLSAAIQGQEVSETTLNELSLMTEMKWEKNCR